MLGGEPYAAEIADFRRRMNARKMLDLPFFRHIVRNRLDSAQLRVFFTQYYSIVRTSYRMLAAGILSAPPEDTFTVEHQVRFLYTEAGGTPTHLGYYLRWAEAFGVSASDLAAGPLGEEAQKFEATLMDIYMSQDSFGKLTAQLATEDCAEVLIEGLNEGFRQYSLNARAYGYLAAHLLLENDEDGHSRWAIDSLSRYPNLGKRFGELEESYYRVYTAFAGVFEGIYRQWHVHAA
jgi:pyrroloquinoline quinone (PQQ) biosynthesis protein C